ncbi:hypothetical protein BDZ94DRAFT_1266613 [Collybia nuda]|uniref:Uncharacterized protein n=1 Tax=Collybia nuda TaxID=64659 RepID=A0A9P5Y0R6_9AGAR|nr:hypothetical protein BDZ94DRAFT_1266613 [Collybia nuda]
MKTPFLSAVTALILVPPSPFFFSIVSDLGGGRLFCSFNSGIPSLCDTSMYYYGSPFVSSTIGSRPNGCPAAKFVKRSKMLRVRR